MKLNQHTDLQAYSYLARVRQSQARKGGSNGQSSASNLKVQAMLARAGIVDIMEPGSGRERWMEPPVEQDEDGPDMEEADAAKTFMVRQ